MLRNTGNRQSMNIPKTGIAIAILLLFLMPETSRAAGDTGPDIFGHPSGIWQVQGTAGQKRWLIIHNLKESRTSGLFHIEIIGRDKGRPAWSVVHVCDHMAITLEALKRSVIRPLKNGAVYPESFNSAYARWKKKADQGRQVICTTTIGDCLCKQE